MSTETPIPDRASRDTPTPECLRADLGRLGCAEDFFSYFALPFDAAVVEVSRLHILKRFNQYLAAQGGLERLPADSAFAACRALLARAHADFVGSSGLEQKVFKVFHAARGEHRVAIDGLRRGG